MRMTVTHRLSRRRQDRRLRARRLAPALLDELSMGWVVEGYKEGGGFLFGRRTYELLAG
jgi:hypothetical protein